MEIFSGFFVETGDYSFCLFQEVHDCSVPYLVAHFIPVLSFLQYLLFLENREMLGRIRLVEVQEPADVVYAEVVVLNRFQNIYTCRMSNGLEKFGNCLFIKHWGSLLRGQLEKAAPFASRNDCEDFTPLNDEIFLSIEFYFISSILSEDDFVTFFYEVLQLFIRSDCNDSTLLWLLLGRIGDKNSTGSLFIFRFVWLYQKLVIDDL